VVQPPRSDPPPVGVLVGPVVGPVVGPLVGPVVGDPVGDGAVLVGRAVGSVWGALVAGAAARVAAVVGVEAEVCADVREAGRTWVAPERSPVDPVEVGRAVGVPVGVLVLDPLLAA